MLAISAVAGFGLAKGLNHHYYGQYDAVFGPMTLDGEVNASNALAELAKSYSDDGYPVAEMIGEKSHDFGTMSLFEEGEHTFVIKNSGVKPLELELGATTCKCTLGELESGELAPGEQTEIKLSWTVKTNEDFFSQSAEIRTNDPANPAVRLAVSGVVVRDISMQPETWTFGEVAAGEEFVTTGKVYSYMEHTVEPAELSFANENLTKLSEFQCESFEPSEEDAPFDDAKQGFLITATTKPGMRQGAISTQFIFSFKMLGEDGKYVVGESNDDEQGASELFYTRVDTTGRIAGAMSFVPNPRMTKTSSSYIYNFGELGKDDSLIAKALLSLKGAEHDKTKLSIGEIFPEQGLKVTISEKFERKDSKIFQLEMEIEPQDERLEFAGQSKGDFAYFWIETDNPKVPRLRVGVKFAVDAKSKSD